MRDSLCKRTVIVLLSFLGIFADISSAQEVGSLARGVVRIEVETLQGKRRKGTGFIAHLTADSAYIVTASHVIEDTREITVEFFTRRNRPVPAAIIGIEKAIPQGGLAALLVTDNIPPGLIELEINRYATVYAGDPVITIGFPAVGSPWSITRGEVTGRRAKTIVFSGAVDEGSSGGPLIREGEVIGVVSETMDQFAYVAPAVIAQYVLESWGVPDTHREALARSLAAESLVLQRQSLKPDPEDEEYYWEDLMTPKGSGELLQLGVLLGVEAMRRSPSPETQETLRAGLGLLTRPIAQITSGVGFAVSTDWRFIANASSGTARIWEIKTGQEIGRFLHDADVTAVALSVDGRYLATGTATGTKTRTYHVWEVASGKETVSMKQDRAVGGVAFSPDGRFLVTAGYHKNDRHAHVWDITSGRERWRSPETLRSEKVVIGPKGNYLAASTDDTTRPGSVWLWEMENGEEVWHREFEERIGGIAFSADGEHLAVSSRGGHPSTVWSIPGGEELVRIMGAHRQATAFSPDGRYLAIEGARGVLVWDLSRAVQRRLIPGDEVVIISKGDVDNLVFSPDGKYLAIDSSGGMASVWEVATGKEIARMQDAGSLNNMAFSPDGQYLISDWRDKVKVWQLWPEDLVAEACVRLDRNLTPRSGESMSAMNPTVEPVKTFHETIYLGSEFLLGDVINVVISTLAIFDRSDELSNLVGSRVGAVAW